MTVETHIYDERFFRGTRRLESASAGSIADILYAHFQPRSVIDVGCGIGIYMEEFLRLGAEVIGYEGSAAALKESRLPEKIIIHDLSQPLRWQREYDLCICLEVAEHLFPEDADTLADTLSTASNNIVFTAATPGQGPRSIGHVNEQPHDYWIEKFAARGFIIHPDNESIRAEMAEAGAVWWITKNLMIFKNNGRN